jgi:hypothetical protein
MVRLHVQTVLPVKCVPTLKVMVFVTAIWGSTRLVKQQVAPRVLVDLPVQIRLVISRWNVNLEPSQLVSKWRVHHVQLDRK